MILRVPRPQSDAILGAMRAIALAHGEEGVADADRQTIAAAAQIVLGRDPGDADSVTPRDPQQLAATMLSPDDARQAIRMLAVLSLADGRVDAGKTALVQQFADALGVDEEYLRILAETAAGEVAQAAACIVRKNAESFPHLNTTGIDHDAIAPFLPYREAPDAQLEARYSALGELPHGSFGRAFHEHFVSHGFAFPGNPAGLAEGFTTPHDSSHVLSGYSTSQLGELCVSTFIGAMHPDHPMSAEVLPVLFSWHLGIHLNDIAGAATGYFEPRRFWTAWDRGAAMSTDIVAADWDFWGATEVGLDELRAQYDLPPAAAELLA
ncbi:hypothetical protein Q5424_07365 [Conexibacter sp. JD483]|uniref:hypothetical protein n=1 Tax=unclassified Conexibacter TaxID=2627773 RepID=UPI002727EC90|nr:MULTISPECIES: hypothetical protein [unclassified Conexibacter]MDO8187136.1 hypothetical protein [Conexibacter sp. CPCC 205706]MDO8200312.1 hypothetical protein [Conexibacter sp. CPCC 205762]MDR9368892.1 hypothetical protein [Conexibacter sp. JD483]